VSPGVRSAIPDGLFAPYELVRPIEARPVATWVVRLAGAGQAGKAQLAMAERFEGLGRKGDPRNDDFVHDARRIATLASPNVARVRDVNLRGDDVVVVSELVEGESLAAMWPPSKLPLEIALRVIVDVLAGAGALHNLRDAKQQPMKLVHGEIAPATIVLGLDGVARLLHAAARCAPGAPAEAASTGYLAPEVAAGDAIDARADVFSAGVLLWEALTGARLFGESDPAAVAKRVRAGAVPPATVSDKTPWAKGLVAVASKALAAEPDDRWATAAAMSAELRKAAGLKLAPASTAAAHARTTFGPAVKARREELGGGASTGTTPGPAATTAMAAASENAASPRPPAASPKPPTASPNAAPASPKAPPVSPNPAHVAAKAPPAPAATAVMAASAPDVSPTDRPASLSEPPVSFSEPPISLSEPPISVDAVLAAPGLLVAVHDVVELSSESLTDAPPSVPPPEAPPPTGAGARFVHDPFATSPAVPRAPAVPVIAPPTMSAAAAAPPTQAMVAPTRGMIAPTRGMVAPTAEEPAPPSVSGSPHFAAAIDLPPPTTVFEHPTTFDPGADDANRTGPSLAMQAEVADQLTRDAKRRKTYVLGGVAALGLIVFVLAVVRIAQHAGEAPSASTASTTSSAATASPPGAATAASPGSPAATAAAATAPSTPSPNAAGAATPPPTAATAPAPATPPTPAPVTPRAAPAARTTPPPGRATTLAAVPHATPPAHAATPPAAKPKPRPKPKFDPNSL